jgi:shikimate kinase
VYKINKNIVLIGMAGCGKTTIGKALSQKLGIGFVNVDDYIEEKIGKTITEIFEQNGEDYFRGIEKEVTYEASRDIGKVISTGGGVIKNYCNIENLKENGIIIFIDRSVENIIKDVDISTRPLMKDGIQRVRILFNERHELYNKYCDFRIVNDGKVEDAISKIVEIIG